MYNKPGSWDPVIRGALLGSVRGITEMLNWCFSWLWNFSVGKGLKLKNADAGRPQLSLDLSAAMVDENGDPLPVDANGNVIVSSSSVGGISKITDTESVYVTGVKSITFASAADSNVKVNVTKDANDDATLTIGVYYV